MASWEWFSARPPGGTEYYYARDNVKSFPEIPIPNGVNVKSFSNSNHSKPSADGDQLMASATDLFKSMTMNEIADEQHCYSNQSYLLDQMIDKAAATLVANAKPFEKEIDNFIATQSEIDAMVSNIPTPKAKHNKNLIPILLLLMHTINGIITN